MADIRTPTTGTFFTANVPGDVPVWNGIEWLAGPATSVGAVRPAGVPDGFSMIDLALLPPRPIWRLAPGWIDATGAPV